MSEQWEGLRVKLDEAAVAAWELSKGYRAKGKHNLAEYEEGRNMAYRTSASMINDLLCDAKHPEIQKDKP